MRTEARLGKIEGALTPKQAVLAWMTQAHAHGSLQAYVDSLQGAPEDAFPLIHLPKQMEDAVERAMRGEPKVKVCQAVRMAVRDAALLYHLASNVNWRAVEHRREHWLHIVLVSTLVRCGGAEDSPRELALGWRQAREAAHTVYVQQGAAQALADQYFGGAMPLFPDVAVDVASQVSEIERVIAILNDILPEVEPPGKGRGRAQPTSSPLLPLDLAELRAAAAPSIDAEVALQVAMAKAEAWELIGEYDQRVPLMAPHIWPASR